MDVVHPGETPWESSPFEATLTEGHIVGRGAADMKGGVAAMAVATVSLVRQGFTPRADLILAVSAGEEVDTAGARLMAASGVLEGAAGIVVGEPTGLDVFRAEKGVLWLKVTAHGRTAHGSMPQLGVNAVSYAVHLARLLEEGPFDFQPSPVLGDPTISINVIEGGVKSNVVPDRCSLVVDLRLVPGQSREAVLKRLEGLMREVALEAGLPVRTEVEILQDMPPVETSLHDPLLEATIGAATRVRGTEPELKGVSYGTDAAVLCPALDASMVIFGPGSPEQAHQPNEYVDVDDLDKAVEAYMLIAREILGS